MEVKFEGTEDDVRIRIAASQQTNCLTNVIVFIRRDREAFAGKSNCWSTGLFGPRLAMEPVGL